MTVPSQNTQIVAQGLARLTSAYITKPNVRALLAVYLQPLQDAETALWQVMTTRFLSTAQNCTLPSTNPVLDTIGQLVGQPRMGLSDSDYKSMLYLRIAVNRSIGRSTDWSNFGRILIRAGALSAVYVDANPNTNQPSPMLNPGEASFLFFLYSLPLNPALVALVLAGACPNGVRGVFGFTTWPKTTGATGDMIWASSYDSTSGSGTWGTHYSGTVGGKHPAAIQMN